MAVAIIVPVVFFLTTATLVIFIRKFTNDERMALIEKGADAKLFKMERSNYYISLRFGLLLIGAGIGVLVGAILDTYTHLHKEPGYLSMLALFAGLGLFSSHLLEKKDRAKHSNN